MNLKTHMKYYLSIGEDDLTFEEYSEVVHEIEIALNEQLGSITLAADDGLRPLWQRLIFGAKNYVRSYMMCEWSENTSGLIFYDENASEYRVLSNVELGSEGASVNKEVSFGEYTPLDAKYLLPKKECIKAISEFLDTGVKPSWLIYEFIE